MHRMFEVFLHSINSSTWLRIIKLMQGKEVWTINGMVLDDHRYHEGTSQHLHWLRVALPVSASKEEDGLYLPNCDAPLSSIVAIKIVKFEARSLRSFFSPRASLTSEELNIATAYRNCPTAVMRNTWHDGKLKENFAAK